MFERVSRLVSTGEPGLARPVATVYAALLLFNAGVWAWAALIFRHQPVLLGTALLAYGFGLRHAVDADHIAAIDNVTRKLMQEGKRPVTVGLFFAMGHSAVVILAAAGIALTAAALHVDRARSVGGLISTSVSAAFLFTIALMNLLIFFSVCRTFGQVRRGGTFVDEDFDLLLNKRGFTARLFRPLFRLIRRSWHMFPLGFLFGLGFDTATEVALLGISATQAAKGVSIWSIMVFPALFAAGMSLIDTTDGILMLGAYDWAYLKPIRKLFYNMVITLVSVLVAVLVGGIEALGLVQDRLGLTGGFWSLIARLNGNFNSLGFIIIGLFITAWVGSVIVYRYKGYEHIEVKRLRPERSLPPRSAALARSRAERTGGPLVTPAGSRSARFP
jgi:nickel/cobalt transporter (NiCoT) family protein